MIPKRTIAATCEISTGTLILDNQVPAYVGESMATDIVVSLKNGGTAYLPSGALAEMYLYWPGTAAMTETVEMDVSGSTLTGTMADVMTARSGCPLLVIQLTDEESGDLIVAASAPIQIINVRGTVVISGRAPSPSEIVYIGRSPYIGSNRHWYQWNVTTRAYVDTGIYARGETPYIRISDEHWMIWDSTTESYVDSGYRATSKSPYVGNNNHWFVWSDASEMYIDTGIYAAGQSPYISPSNHWMVWDSELERYADSGIYVAGKSPYVNSTTGTWMIWNAATEVYDNSGIVARGMPATFTATATTLPAGSDATATMGGTVENPILYLGIPRGYDGAVLSVNSKTGHAVLDGSDIVSGQVTPGNTINEDLSELDTRTTSEFTGATSSEAGEMGMVPAPASGQTSKFLKSNGTWATPDDSEISSTAVSGQTTVEGALGSLSQQIDNLALEIGPYMFEINNSGHLILYYPDDYSGSSGPPFRLAADGHLYYDY